MHKVRILTADPGLPVQKTLPDVLELQILAGRTELVILLQTANNDGALLLGQELGRVGEVLDNPERRSARDDGEEAFEDKDPRPAGLAADAVHVRDRGL